MKYLSIIRHGKTEPAEEVPRDFDRVLTKRGERDAALIASMLKSWDLPPDWLVTSPAARALATAQIIARHLDNRKVDSIRPELYLAEPETVLQVLSRTPAKAVHVAVVAHNPGLELAAAQLCVAAPHQLQVAMPTAGVAHIALEIARWDQIRWGCGRLEFLVRPKLVRRLVMSD